MLTRLVRRPNLLQPLPCLLRTFTDVTGKQRCRLCQCRVIMPRRGNGSLATPEFHAPALPDPFRLAKQNAADLAGVLDVSPAARRQIKVSNIDEAQFVLIGP